MTNLGVKKEEEKEKELFEMVGRRVQDLFKGKRFVTNIQMEDLFEKVYHEVYDGVE